MTFGMKGVLGDLNGMEANIVSLGTGDWGETTKDQQERRSFLVMAKILQGLYCQ